MLVPSKLLDSIVAYFNPARVILFGSRARGDAGPESDVDLLVVVDDDTPPERRSWQAAHEARRGYHDPVDIVVCSASGYAYKRDVVGSLAHTAETEGVVVYERH